MFLKQNFSTGIAFGNVADCGGSKRQMIKKNENSDYDFEQFAAQPETASNF